MMTEPDKATLKEGLEEEVAAAAARAVVGWSKLSPKPNT
jgi:hypothetical protein